MWSCTNLFKKYFVDLRFMAILMCVWLIIVLSVLFDLGVFTRSKFVAFGPRDDLTFMHVSIDTLYKYYMLIAMIFCHTFITDLIADSLVPHVLNVVQDTKNKYIPHRTRTYLLITSVWSIYCSVSQLFVIFIAFGQLDLLLVRLASDLIANSFTLNMYLDSKFYDPELHAQSVASSSTNTRCRDPKIFVISDEDEDDVDRQEIVYNKRDTMNSAKIETDILTVDETHQNIQIDEDEKVGLLPSDKKK